MRVTECDHRVAVLVELVHVERELVPRTDRLLQRLERLVLALVLAAAGQVLPAAVPHDVVCPVLGGTFYVAVRELLVRLLRPVEVACHARLPWMTCLNPYPELPGR